MSKVHKTTTKPERTGKSEAEPSTQPIAIVGMAAMFPKSPDLKGFWHLIRAGISGISEIPESHWRPEDYFDGDPKAPDKTYCKTGGFIPNYKFDPTEFSLPPTALEATDTTQLLGLVVAKAALEDAGYNAERPFTKDKTSIILGVTGTLELVVPLGARLGYPIWRKALIESGVSTSVIDEVMTRMSDGFVPWQENSFPGLLGNVVAGRIANRLDLQGTNCVVDAACASSLSASHLAMLELATGKADMVVTGGTDTFNDVFMYMCFSKTPALSACGQIRPFAEASDGTLIGEGLGMLVFKRLEDARNDGDRIYAVIKGIGTASDGNSGAVYAPSSEGQARALRAAYRDAGVSPETVTLVEAHGTGTKVGDVVEFEGLRSVYSEAGTQKNWCALGSVKSQIGHTKAAAGAASLIKTALALYNKVLPPSLGIEKPNPKLNVQDSPFYLNTVSRPWVSQPGHPRRAAASSFGFGGSNFHIVLEEAEPVRSQVAWDGSLRLVAFSGPDAASVANQLRHTAQEVAGKEFNEQAIVAHKSCEQLDATQPARAVVLWPLEANLEALLKSAADKVAEGQPLDGPELYFRCGSDAGKLVFMFPGQGSQYVEMGRELACIFPEFLESLEDLNQAAPEAHLVAKMYPPPSFAPDVAKANDEALTRTDAAQPALGAINRALFEILSQRYGLRPDFACGHSYGELCALYASGCYDAQSLNSISLLRGQLMAKGDGGRGTMAAITAPIEKVEAKVAELKLDVVVANRNSHTQCVLSGTKEAVKDAAAKLKEAGMRAIPLQVGAAFHSSLVASAEKPFREGLSKIKFYPGQIPVVANKTAQNYPAQADAAKDLLSNQLVSQVNWVAQIEALYAQGARTFIEVGPKNVLTKLVGAILKGKPHQVLAVDASTGKTGLLDLAKSLAWLAALGYPVQLNHWESAPEAPRKRKMTVEICGANYRAPHGKNLPPVREPNSVVPRSSLKATAVALADKRASAPLTVTARIDERPKSEAVESQASPKLEPKAAVPTAPATPVVSAPRAAAPGWWQEAFQQVQNTLLAVQALQQQTAKTHQKFLEGQEAAQKTFQVMVESQRRLMEGMATGIAPAREMERPAPPPKAAAPAPQQAQAPPPAKSAPASAPAPQAVAPSPAPQAPAPQAQPQVSQALLALVAEKTGYPQEMLNLDMDLEADLGVDSIKRVEILAATQEKLPHLPTVPSDKMGSLRTLRQIVEALSGPSNLATTVAEVKVAVTPPSASSPPVADKLLAVVADKTGYPQEMLNLAMDLEADLGIDSIKRVEILAAVEEAVPGLPKIEPDKLGSLRTLGQIVEAFGASLPHPHPWSPDGDPSARTPVEGPVGSPAPVAGKLLAVVAEKTGYPQEMLNLAMDLEADLGIDSIKRVEILAAVEEAVPGLPKIEPDKLGSLRTLGQIVEAFGASAAPAPVAAGPTDAVAPQLLAVVSDKTGYPLDMLKLEMDLEADLGIDSIKRVEILAAVEERVPGLPKIDSEKLGSLRTLAQIVQAFGSRPSLTAAPVVTTSTPPLTERLLAVVAEKTGYPKDMLNLDMDLEADLGIDSIKRVEILASVDDGSRLPSELVGSLRTLRQVADALLSSDPNHPAKMNGLRAQQDAPATTAEPASRLERRELARKAADQAPTGKLPLAAGSKVAIVSDGDVFAEALGKLLSKAGFEVGSDAGQAGLAALFLVGGGKTQESFLKQAFQATRQAAAALEHTAQKGMAMLVSVARMDGEFGLRQGGSVAGGLTGLPKTAAHEWPSVHCRAFDVDAGWSDPKAAAQAVINELSQPGPLEVGLSAQSKVILQTPRHELQAGQALFQAGDVILVTGGARGVTSATAIALAQAMKPTLILLGRSAPPSQEPAWLSALSQDGEIKKAILQHHFGGKATPKEIETVFRQFMAQREVLHTLQAIQAAGAKVEYRALDVRNVDAVKAMVGAVRSQHGPIRGIIHAAGVLADKRIQEKTDEMFDAVFSTKVQGLNNLLDALKGEDLKALLLFSSVTARFGRPGQVDYCMANDVLNKLAQSEARKRPNCRVVSLNWGPWAGGMVTEGLKKEFQRLGVGLIPLEAGAQALVRELSTPPGGAVEVLYGDGFPEPPQEKPLAAQANAGDGVVVFETTASVADYPCLESHKLGGRPVVPVALQLEWLAHAALHGKIGPRFVGLEDLQIFRPLALDDTSLLVSVVDTGDHYEIRTPAGLHARAKVVLNGELPSAPAVQDAAPLKTQAYPLSAADIYSELLFHGRHFQGIRLIQGWSQQGMVATVEVAPKVSEWVSKPVRTDWVADPMVIDVALQMGILWGIQALGKPSLPLRVGSYTQYQKRFPKSAMQANLHVTHSTPHKIVIDVELVDKDGRLVAALRGAEFTADAALARAFERESRSVAQRG